MARMLRRTITTFAIQYKTHGEPLSVLNINSSPLPELEENQVHFSTICAPINPADINQIQGTYPLIPTLPAIGGNEGLFVVQKISPSLQNKTTLKEGDWVIPSQATYGTWRTEGVWDISKLLKIPNDIPFEFAATVSVNPSTAYRMLKDFVDLKEGDCIIQNAANSGVGKAVIQLASLWKIQTINIVRKRENFAELEKELYDLGASVVVTEDQLVNATYMKDMLKNTIKVPVSLALNGVGGDNATNMCRHLKEGGTMVTYGGMSKKPVLIPTGNFIFKNHILKGFWMTRWSTQNTSEDKSRMLQELCSYAKQGKFQVATEKIPFFDFKTAITNTTKPFHNLKQLLVMDEKYL